MLPQCFGNSEFKCKYTHPDCTYSLFSSVFQDIRKHVRAVNNHVLSYILQLIFQKLSYYLTLLNRCY